MKAAAEGGIHGREMGITNWERDLGKYGGDLLALKRGRRDH